MIKTIEIKRKPLEIKDFVKRSAATSDYQALINEPCLITENGVPRILYAKVEPDQYCTESPTWQSQSR